MRVSLELVTLAGFESADENGRGAPKNFVMSNGARSQ